MNECPVTKEIFGIVQWTSSIFQILDKIFININFLFSFSSFDSNMNGFLEEISKHFMKSDTHFSLHWNNVWNIFMNFFSMEKIVMIWVEFPERRNYFIVWRISYFVTFTSKYFLCLSYLFVVNNYSIAPMLKVIKWQYCYLGRNV